MLSREELECYKDQSDVYNMSHLFGHISVTLEKRVFDKIIISHLEALAKIKQLENEIERRDRVTPTTW